MKGGWAPLLFSLTMDSLKDDQCAAHAVMCRLVWSPILLSHIHHRGMFHEPAATAALLSLSHAVHIDPGKGHME